MKFKRRSHPSITTDATPMADMVFLLLIFFMLSSSFIMQSGIKIKLPEAVTSEAQLEKHLILTVSEDKKIFLNEKQIEMHNLLPELKNIFIQREDKLLIIKADQRVFHGTVVDIMDKARLAGAEKLAIATEIKK